MYYVLDCDIPEDERGGYLDIDDGIEIPGLESWKLGERFDVQIPDPLVIHAVAEGGYDGLPPEMSDGTVPLFSGRLTRALREAGVDNLDTYPALILDDTKRRRYEYFAINVIGLIAAADLGLSEWDSYDEDATTDTSFESLALREEATGGALFFRLAENVGTIIVHEHVRDRLVAAGIDTLKFIEPEDWVVI